LTAFDLEDAMMRKAGQLEQAGAGSAATIYTAP